jgi:hypothetical protein
MRAVSTPDDELIAISGWTDDDVAVLYAAAVLEELALIELVERLNELNQNKMLSIGAGQASNLLHEFWDKGYTRMPPKRRAALFAGLFDDAFAGLLEALARALAQGSPEAVAPAAAALRDDLAEHAGDETAQAAAELRGTLREIAGVLSDMELLGAYRAGDMWQLVECVQEELDGGADVRQVRARATCGARILHGLPALGDCSDVDEELVAAAGKWLPTSSPAAY